MKGRLIRMLQGDPDVREAIAEIAREAVPVARIPEPEPAPEERNLDADIRAAIRDLEGTEDAFGQDGKPKVKAIEAAMGGADITAADRDRVWAAMQENA